MNVTAEKGKQVYMNETEGVQDMMVLSFALLILRITLF